MMRRTQLNTRETEEEKIQCRTRNHNSLRRRSSKKPRLHHASSSESTASRRPSSAARPHSHSPAADVQLSETHSTTTSSSSSVSAVCSVARTRSHTMGTDSGLMTHESKTRGGTHSHKKVQRSCGSLIEQRVLFLVPSRSRRGIRCNHCKTDTATRDIVVGDILQDRRQPGHQNATTSQTTSHWLATNPVM